MIRDIDKVSNLNGTALRYRKKETMEGLYFKEMLSKIGKFKNKKDNERDSKKENNYEEIITHDIKVERKKEHQEEHQGEGTFLDKFC